MTNSVYSNIPHIIDEMKMAITEYIRNVYRAILNTVFENTVRRVNKFVETGGDTLNVTCNFLCCTHQVYRDFLITLYKECFYHHGRKLVFETGVNCLRLAFN
jgi:hypothetical protein